MPFSSRSLEGSDEGSMQVREAREHFLLKPLPQLRRMSSPREALPRRSHLASWTGRARLLTTVVRDDLLRESKAFEQGTARRASPALRAGVIIDAADLKGTECPRHGTRYRRPGREVGV